MQLSYISITNYRSITDANRLDLSEITVLLGKNNVGKTNIIRAINIGMHVLEDMENLHRRKKLPKQVYDWNEDFPIALRKKRIKNKATTIRMDFTLDEKETEDFYQEIHSLINGNLSVFIEISEENNLKVSLPKRGKNASAMTNSIVAISKFICERFGIQYIPAVRSENDAYRSIVDLVDDELSSIDDQKYQDALDYIEKIQKDCLKELAAKVKKPLNTFLPQIKSIELYKSSAASRVMPFA